jgi:hypothetical protein
MRQGIADSAGFLERGKGSNKSWSKDFLVGDWQRIGRILKLAHRCWVLC